MTQSGPFAPSAEREGDKWWVEELKESHNLAKMLFPHFNEAEISKWASKHLLQKRSEMETPFKPSNLPPPPPSAPAPKIDCTTLNTHIPLNE